MWWHWQPQPEAGGLMSNDMRVLETQNRTVMTSTVVINPVWLLYYGFPMWCVEDYTLQYRTINNITCIDRYLFSYFGKHHHPVSVPTSLPQPAYNFQKVWVGVHGSDTSPEYLWVSGRCPENWVVNHVHVNIINDTFKESVWSNINYKASLNFYPLSGSYIYIHKICIHRYMFIHCIALYAVVIIKQFS